MDKKTAKERRDVGGILGYLAERFGKLLGDQKESLTAFWRVKRIDEGHA